MVAVHADLARRLTELEGKVDRLESSHDSFSNDTRTQLRQIFDVLRALTMPPDPPRRPIGFLAPEDNDKPQKQSPKEPPKT